MRFISISYTTTLNSISSNSARSERCFTLGAKPFMSWVRFVIHRLGELRSLGSHHELKVKKIIDRQGQISYRVYDPVPHQYYTFTCENALRVWLDQRYYW